MKTSCELRNTFSGCTLRSGALFFGWMMVVYGIGLMCYSVKNLICTIYVFEDDYISLHSNGITTKPDIVEDMTETKSDYVECGIVTIIITAAYLLNSVILVIGVFKKKPNLILPSWICIVVILIHFCIYTVYIMFFTSFEMNEGTTQVLSFTGLHLFSLYFIVGYYRQLHSNMRRRVLNQRLLFNELVPDISRPIKVSDRLLGNLS
ncbi:uncharacterized protein LOC142319184 [Lycorma delicatula]|uniref:uncharacterized protein LOC142319184 n=1 Tax=Lycorma delicatula TaxID=130591 RepID=UPI003F518732